MCKTENKCKRYFQDNQWFIYSDSIQSQLKFHESYDKIMSL